MVEAEVFGPHGPQVLALHVAFFQLKRVSRLNDLERQEFNNALRLNNIMELEGFAQGVETVDPEVRAYVYSLVTALGSTSSDDSGRYALGDDALACLRDLKRWLKLYDEKANRLDVARCLAEANLVNGDLLPILASWPEDAKEDRLKARVALACLELLVPLTWPIESSGEMTVNHHRHTPYLQQAQVLYKRWILDNDTANILRTVVRIGLPSMTISGPERGSRDQGIIKLMLYFLRNVSVISQSPSRPSEGDENEVSRSATIEAFQYQDVFALILTICSNMGEEFSFQDVIIVEILFHLVKGVDVEKLFITESQRKDKGSDELRDLLKKESGMNREYSRTAPTRHGRFGTMIWVKRDDEKVSTVSGQDVLSGGRTTLLKMDKTKKWNKPQQRSKDAELSRYDFDVPNALTSAANKHLRIFIEEFLDSGFNPLFTHVRKAIERESERVLDMHYRQFFFLVSWFLQAERVRRSCQKEAQKRKNPEQVFEADSFALVASVLNQETFITFTRYMQNSYDNKEWQDLNASMRCFTQILLTVHEMAQSTLEEDQEIAENIQNRIFYEETTHERVISILASYKDQGFGYLDACTELFHVFLRMLERYSKENVDLQVRSRRRAGRRKKTSEAPNKSNDSENDDGSEAEDIAEAARVSKERKFDFTRFAAKFTTQKCVDTFVAFTVYYRELSDEQLKRAHRFFYRVAFKQELSVLLFRVDIIALFYKLIKGPEGLDSSKPIYREWDELVRQVLKRMVKKLDQRPQLIIEMLFSKINATVYFLEHGHEKQTSKSQPRVPAEFEISPRGGTSLDSKIKIVVAVLHLEEKLDLVLSMVDILESAVSERKNGEAKAEARRDAEADRELSDILNPTELKTAPSIVVKPPDNDFRNAMFKNGKLRLLMTLASFERLGVDDVPGATWMIPSSLTSTELDTTREIMQKYCRDIPSPDEEFDPESLMRRKATADDGGPRAEFDDDSESDASDGNEDYLFPANPRKPKSRSDALEELKQKRRQRRLRDDEEDEMDDEILAARRKARAEAALERRKKIKSDAYIHDSDEEADKEADKEFFAKEEERRKSHASKIIEALKSGAASNLAEKSKKRKSTGDGDGQEKRRKRVASDSEDQSGDDDELMIGLESSSSQRRNSNSSDEESSEETPLSSQGQLPDHDDSRKSSLSETVIPGESKTAKIASAITDQQGLDDDEVDDDDISVIAAPRRRMRAGFIVDSDSE